MQSANPALSTQVFSRFGRPTSQEGVMTTSGTMLKTALLLLLTMLTAGWTWVSFIQGSETFVSGALMVGLFGGFVVALCTIFKPIWAPFTAPLYALLEGLFLGGLSAAINAQYPGIAFQAMTLTFGVLAVMLFIYQSGLIEVTNRFRFGVVAATGGVALIYFVSIILGFFGIQVPFIFGNGMFGILFSLFVVGLAALNLILDFDFIDRGSRAGAPKYMEWYGAFALMVTLVWLYIEVLRLLSKLRSR